MPLLTIADLKKEVRQNTPLEAHVHVQIERILKKDAANGKPFYEIVLRDSTESMTLRAWSDTAAFESASLRHPGDFVSVEGVFHHNGSFGLDARGWDLSLLSDEETDLLLQGSPERRFLLEKSWQVISDAVDSLGDLRLQALCRQFLEQHGARFRRAAAARGNHHARRGGLLEHTSRMMECALALCGVYQELNRDLLIAGVLFHDTGKLWETCPPERGFGIETDLRGELLGHLSIGVELVNALWRDLPKKDWQEMSPPSEELRLHLLHLVAAHHGQFEFGSPVLPKTPEAALLHFIDNIDARLEMFFAAYKLAAVREGGDPPSMDWIRPLGVTPVIPLHGSKNSNATNSPE
jgi:3'-5' exoribonuclease